MNAVPTSTGLRIRFGDAAAGDSVRLPLPLLAGEPVEEIVPGLREIAPRAGFRLFARKGLLMGVADEPRQADLAAHGQELYARLLEAAAGHDLVRIWNYVPAINAPGPGGLENYQAFCRGRSLAFEAGLGAGYRRQLPSASAVGGAPDRLAAVFLAARGQPVHFENPDQVPAYDYPPEHGPRSPSFARATAVEAGGLRLLCVSGTAAIKGHETQAVGDLPGQVACLLDNLAVLSARCGLKGFLGADEGWTRHVKIYLRHAADLPVVAARCAGNLCREGDRVTWLQAEICREALLVEAEATLVAGA